METQPPPDVRCPGCFGRRCGHALADGNALAFALTQLQQAHWE